MKMFQKWSNFRLSWAPDLDLDLGSGHGHYLFSSLIEYYLYTKFHRNRRNFLWTNGRTDGNSPPTVLGRLPKFGSRPNDTAYYSASTLSWTQTTVADKHKFSAIRRLSRRLLDRSKSAIVTHPTCIWRSVWGDPTKISSRSVAS